MIYFVRRNLYYFYLQIFLEMTRKRSRKASKPHVLNIWAYRYGESEYILTKVSCFRLFGIVCFNDEQIY